MKAQRSSHREAKRQRAGFLSAMLARSHTRHTGRMFVHPRATTYGSVDSV